MGVKLCKASGDCRKRGIDIGDLSVYTWLFTVLGYSLVWLCTESFSSPAIKVLEVGFRPENGSIV